MPKRGLRMFLTSMLLVCALALSFTVGAFALDSGEDLILSADQDISEFSVSESAASTTDTVVGSPTDANSDSSANNGSSGAFGTDNTFSDLPAIEPSNSIIMSGGATGQLALSFDGKDLPELITPGSTFEIPVYLATDNLQIWQMTFFIDFNSDALELVTGEDGCHAIDGAYLTINNDSGNSRRFTAMLVSVNPGEGFSSSSYSSPTKFFTLVFKMPETAAAVSAVKKGYNGSDPSIDGILNFNLSVSYAVVSPAGLGWGDSNSQTSIEGDQAANLSPKPATAPAGHNHTYNDEQGKLDESKGFERDPTCTKDGGFVYVCDLCGNEEGDILEGSHLEISPTGKHTFTKRGELVSDRPEGTPSCLPYRVRMYCSVCTETEEYEDVYVDDVPHGQSTAAHSLTFHAAVEPTADTAGNKPYYSCSVCGLNFLGDDSSTSSNGTDYAKAANIVDLKDTEVPPTSGGRFPGDADESQVVDGTDATIILRYAANKAIQDMNDSMGLNMPLPYDTLCNPNMSNSDVDASGSVDGTDATIILRYAANKAIQDMNDSMGLNMPLPYDTLCTLQ